MSSLNGETYDILIHLPTAIG